MPKIPKQKASLAQSRYIRLKEAIEYCKMMRIDLNDFHRPEDILGICVTCAKVQAWIRMQGGHYKSRGSGGHSGAYFLEENIHTQCTQCNRYDAGRPEEYRQYLVDRYGEDEVQRIELRHKLPLPTMSFEGLKMMYEEMYKGLLAVHWNTK